MHKLLCEITITLKINFNQHLMAEITTETIKPRILVAPLDWGLGHATRCIPIIKELLKMDCAVWLAGEGAQEKLLSAEFPQLPFLQLKGYRVKYPKTTFGMLWSMIRQYAKITRAINYEHQWLNEAVEQYHFDAVISDNRYGLYHSSIPCIFITHQLYIKSPLGKWSEKLLQRKNYSYIKRFTACWVPDNKDEINLAGELSHPQKMPLIPTNYIGILSRFSKNEIQEINDHLLIILSGPEPQRSLLENKIVDEASRYAGTATIVRGLPDGKQIIPSTQIIQCYNHLSADELNNEMQKAEYVIARSGYSTVMDVAALSKKSILIPTPGQTEQEYLAKSLSEKNFAPFIIQKNFTIANALEKAKSYAYKNLNIENATGLLSVIANFVNSLKKE